MIHCVQALQRGLLITLLLALQRPNSGHFVPLPEIDFDSVEVSNTNTLS